MNEAPAIVSLLAELGLRSTDAPAVVAAERYSNLRLEQARRRLAAVALPDPAHAAMATLALGSIGRREASEQSDLDLAFVYDSRKTTRTQAEAWRAAQIDTLGDGGFDIPQKTFRRAVDLEDLVHNVGGARDSNERLTYRALLLTEGAWLCRPEAAHAVKRAIFGVYAGGRITRGRFLNSLANDLHRYYRTVCVDYRHKVEEQDKTWAIRSLKLRHSRKLWHLANLAVQLWAVDAVGDDAQRDEALAERLDWPTLVRLAESMRHFDALSSCAPVIRAYDVFLAGLAEPDTRAALARLPWAEREACAAYVRLRGNAQALDDAAAAVVDVLWARRHEHLIRFCLL